MTNLLKETIKKLGECGKTLSDIEWIGNREALIPLEFFVDIANTTYDNGYGLEEVRKDLIVAGDGWWLEREEYDGSEWWEYKTQPTKPKTTATVKSKLSVFLKEAFRHEKRGVV